MKEEILEDIRIQKGWHLCGMETVDEHDTMRRKVASTPEFEQWEKTMYQGERRALNDLLCTPSFSAQAGLVAITFRNLFQGNIIETLDGPMIGRYGLQSYNSYYCANN